MRFASYLFSAGIRAKQSNPSLFYVPLSKLSEESRHRTCYSDRELVCLRRYAQMFGMVGCLTATVMLFSVVIPIRTAEASTESSSHIVQTNAPSSGLFRKTVVVDAGHGGVDSGARGIEGLQEKDITLAVTMRLTHYLQQAGAVVVLTRQTDTDLSTASDKANKHRHMGDLRGRFGVVRSRPIDAFISIHCNATNSPDWHGSQVLYLKGNAQGKTLATMMQSAFRVQLLPTKRAIQSNQTLYLLKRVKGPTVLAEIGFITNPMEARYLHTAAYQDRVAFAMYTAIVAYFADPTDVTESSSNRSTQLTKEQR